jgi:hypothetical protein
MKIQWIPGIAALALVFGVGTPATAATVTINFSQAGYACADPPCAGGPGALEGSLGVATTTVVGWPQLEVSAWYWDGGGWTQSGATLWRRHVPNDNGLGVCSPGENCPSGGDYNEISNNLWPELLRVTRPDGWLFTGFGLSSLDPNPGTPGLPVEHGILNFGHGAGLPGAPGMVTGSTFTFAYAGDVEPSFAIAPMHQDAHYLWFEAFNWNNPNATDNDFLVRSITLQQQQVPEPGTLALLGLGVAGLVATRRRR